MNQRNLSLNLFTVMIRDAAAAAAVFLFIPDIAVSFTDVVAAAAAALDMMINTLHTSTHPSDSHVKTLECLERGPEDQQKTES
jgi:hypothetical protein